MPDSKVPLPLTFQQFQKINKERCEEDFGHVLNDPNGWTAEQWSNALAGEVGELCNLIKKKFSRRQKELGDLDIPDIDLGMELADIVAYTALIASFLGYDLGTLTKDKFNIVSDRLGSNKKL